MSAELVARLRDGCVMHPRRWSGDTHDDLGGSIREGETDALMAEAADMIDTLRAQLEAAEAERDEALRLQMQSIRSCNEMRERAEAAESDWWRVRELAGKWRNDVRNIYGQGPSGAALLPFSTSLSPSKHRQQN